MKNKKKLLVVLACLALCVCTVITGTLAWLTDKTETVTNTFTTSDINITLTETKGDVVDGKHQFKMVPGATIEKDPKVTVLADSEDCWLFVKIEKSANFSNYMTYATTGDWTLLETEGNFDIYYYSNETMPKGTAIQILAGDCVSVKNDVEKDDMTAAKNNAPTLSFTAYAVQKLGIDTAALAWAEAEKLG